MAETTKTAAPAGAPGAAAPEPTAPAAVTATDETITVPVMAERLIVEKRRRDAGGIRVTKVIREHEEEVDVALLREMIDVERVAVGRYLDEPAVTRYEGDTMIVPVMEEVLVVEKRLMLKEELHIRKRQFQAHSPQSYVVRSEEAIVEDLSATEGEAPGPGGGQEDPLPVPSRDQRERGGVK